MSRPNSYKPIWILQIKRWRMHQAYVWLYALLQASSIVHEVWPVPQFLVCSRCKRSRPSYGPRSEKRTISVAS